MLPVPPDVRTPSIYEWALDILIITTEHVKLHFGCSLQKSPVSLEAVDGECHIGSSSSSKINIETCTSVISLSIGAGYVYCEWAHVI